MPGQQHCSSHKQQPPKQECVTKRREPPNRPLYTHRKQDITPHPVPPRHQAQIRQHGTREVHTQLKGRPGRQMSFDGSCTEILELCCPILFCYKRRASMSNPNWTHVLSLRTRSPHQNVQMLAPIHPFNILAQLPLASPITL